MEKKRIIWAVDPFADEKELQRSAAWAIKALTKAVSSIITPIYFWRAPIMDMPFGQPYDCLPDVCNHAQEELNKILSRIQLNGLKPLRVMSAPYISTREEVENITQLAKQWRADLIVTSTRAHRGLKRLALGSFAETLLLYSDVPLFFVNPLWDRVPNFKHILFPTDFSDESKEAFDEVLKFAGLMGSEITVFNRVEYIQPLYCGYSYSSTYSDLFKQDIKNREKLAANWASEAKASGVSVTSEIDHQKSGAVEELILARVKKRPGLIAMASHSGPVQSALLGSLTRKVVRLSPDPVWVLHPKLDKLSA